MVVSLLQISKNQSVPAVDNGVMEILPAVRRSDEPVEPVVSRILTFKPLQLSSCEFCENVWLKVLTFLYG